MNRVRSHDAGEEPQPEASAARAPGSPPIEASVFGVLEAYFRREGLPELSNGVTKPDASRREALMGGPVLLSTTVFYVAYFWSAIPRWVWPVAFATLAISDLAREDVQRSRLRNLSGRTALLLIGLLLARTVPVVVRGAPIQQYVPFLCVLGLDVLKVGVGVGFVPIELARSLLGGALAARRVAASIPAMLAVVLFVFVTGGAWRLFGTLDGFRTGVGLGALALVTWLVLRGRLRELTVSIVEPSAERAISMPPLMPADAYIRRMVVLPPNPIAVPQAARRNIRNALTSLTWLRLLGASFVLMVGLATLGFLTIGPAQTTEYVGSRDYANPVAIAVNGHMFMLSLPLIKVAAWLAGLSALSYVIVALDSVSARDVFLKNEFDELSRSLAAWQFYEVARRAVYSAALQSDTSRPSGLDELERGDRLFYLGDFSGAEEEWQEAAGSPDDTVRGIACFDLGMLCDQAGRLTEAKELYASSAASGNAAAMFNLAAILSDEGTKEGALDLLRQVIETGDPEMVPRARRMLGLVDAGRVWHDPLGGRVAGIRKSRKESRSHRRTADDG